VRLGDRRRVDATLSSARIELPAPQKQTPDAKKAGSASAQATGKGGKSKQKFVFPDTPLPLERLQGMDAKVEVIFGELTLDNGTLRDVSAILDLDHGRLSIDFQAKGVAAGRIGQPHSACAFEKRCQSDANGNGARIADRPAGANTQ